ncbi:TIGR01777 family oxidoreductase [Ilumatobacter nonamiensis]|uniref:TIGR01777 family oxidoreductase n=1 Tax=Ilumatobacter nonamiensis TaxID=467093 RepID=UPI0005913DC2|nr:TIGR01777 family oxidoreductase [Ilumatobacter nonamiensis]
MRIAITGASGLVGTALSDRLRDDGHEVTPVVRHSPGDNEIGWSVDEQRIEDGAFDGVDGVVHLAGAGIADERWTDDRKREIRESRTVGTSLVANAVTAAKNGPSVLLSGSAIGIYGTSLDATFDERSPIGTGFLADTCEAWEAAAAPATGEGARVAFLRSGIVLSANGGALEKQLPLFKFGLGGKMGSGDQWQSWIHIDDEVGAIVHLLTSSIDGPVNLTAPNPVTNAEFTDTLGDVLGRPTFLPIPKFGPKLLLGGELADNLLFTGQKVVPSVLESTGYTFAHPTLDGALRDLLS